MVVWLMGADGRGWVHLPSHWFGRSGECSTVGQYGCPGCHRCRLCIRTCHHRRLLLLLLHLLVPLKVAGHLVGQQALYEVA